MFEKHLEESWIETVVLPRRLLILNDFFHNQTSEVDSTVVGDGESNDLNHSGDVVESADFWSENMAYGCEEKMSFLWQMILIYHPGKYVVLVQGALHLCEESEKFLVGRIFNKVVRWKMKSSV